MLNNYRAKFPSDRHALLDKAGTTRLMWGSRPYALGTSVMMYVMSAVHDPDHEAIWHHMSALEGADRLAEWNKYYAEWHIKWRKDYLGFTTTPT